MITASIVTYNHHLPDIEPVLRSLMASPVDIVWIIDHSDKVKSLNSEVQEFYERIDREEESMHQKIESGFKMYYFHDKNDGYGCGHNEALYNASREHAEYHLVVNPDVWFGPEVIPALKEYMDLHHDVGQMMPRVLYPDGYVQPLAKMLPSPMDFFGRLCLPPRLIAKRNAWFELHDTNCEMVLDVPYLSGCFMFFRMEAIKKIGYFDKRFFMYAEDIDVTRRIHEHYKTIFYPKVSIYHKFSRASRRSLWLFWVHVKNIIMYLNKWGWFFDSQRDAFNRALENQIKQGGLQ